jgi:hypothetical protein
MYPTYGEGGMGKHIPFWSFLAASVFISPARADIVESVTSYACALGAHQIVVSQLSDNGSGAGLLRSLGRDQWAPKSNLKVSRKCLIEGVSYSVKILMGYGRDCPSFDTVVRIYKNGIFIVTSSQIGMVCYSGLNVPSTMAFNSVTGKISLLRSTDDN